MGRQALRVLAALLAISAATAAEPSWTEQECLASYEEMLIECPKTGGVDSEACCDAVSLLADEECECFNKLASYFPGFAVDMDSKLSQCSDQELFSEYEDSYFYSCIRTTKLTLTGFDALHSDTASEEEVMQLLSFLDRKEDEDDPHGDKTAAAGDVDEEDFDDVWTSLGKRPAQVEPKPMIVGNTYEEDYSDDWDSIAASRFPSDEKKPGAEAVKIDTVVDDSTSEQFYLFDDDWYEDMPVPEHLMKLLVGRPDFDDDDYEEEEEEEETRDDDNFDIEVETTVECDEDDLLCQSLMQAHTLYEGKEDRVKVLDGEQFSLGELVQQALSDTFGSGAEGVARDLQVWVAEAVREATRMAGLDKLLGFGDADISLDVQISHEVDEPDSPITVDVEMDVALDADDDDTDAAAEGGFLNIDVDIEDLSDAEAQRVGQEIDRIMGKVDLSSGVEAITEEIVPALQHSIPQVLDSGDREVVWETILEISHEEEDEGEMSDVDEYLHDDDADRTVSSDTTVSMDAANLDWEWHTSHPGLLPEELASDEGSLTDSAMIETYQAHDTAHKLSPIVLQSASSLLPQLSGQGAPISMKVNPQNPNEIILTVDVDLDAGVSLTVENESGEDIFLTVEDDFSDTTTSLDLLSGNSLMIRSDDKAALGYEMSVLPYVFQDMQQVSEFYYKQSVPNKINLEITVENQVSVAAWESAGHMRLPALQARPDSDVEVLVEAGAQGGDIDVTIDMYDSPVMASQAEDSITVEVDLQLGQADSIDITLDFGDEGRPYDSMNLDQASSSYVVNQHLQQYIHRLEWVLGLVYVTVCLALLSILYYLYQLYTGACEEAAEEFYDHDEEYAVLAQQEDEEKAALSLPRSSVIEDARQHINVIMATSVGAEDRTADGYYMPLPERDYAPLRQ